MITANIYLIFTNYSPIQTEIDADKKDDLLNDVTNTPKVAGYSPSFEGNGTEIDISLHQSLYDETSNQYQNTDFTSSFNLACPKDLDFNSSYINITISDIEAPNKTLIVEDDINAGITIGVDGHFGSFEARGAGYIENISINTYYIIAATTFDIELWNATYEGGAIRPNETIGTNPIVDDESILQNTPYWHNMTNLHIPYNSSETYNNTFFFKFIGSGGVMVWSAAYDVSAGDADPEHLAYDKFEDLEEVFSETIDFTLIIDFAPAERYPTPEALDFKINSTPVIGDPVVTNKGYWESYTERSSLSGNLTLNVKTDKWWDVKYSVLKSQVNYTRTNLKANSSFFVPYGGSDVLWNITRNSEFNEFDSRFGNYKINYTVPSNWDHGYRAFNGSTEILTLDTSAPIINGYKEISVLNAGNGTDWFFLANSTNLIQTIGMYINGTSDLITQASSSYILHFNATFSENLGNGDINLSVFNPLPETIMNFTYSRVISASASEISITDWVLADNITGSGNMRVQVFWNNLTAVGYNQTLLDIILEQSTFLETPNTALTAIRGQVLNYTFNYSNGGGIESATIDELYVPSDLITTIYEDGQGNYTIELDTSNLNALGYLYEYNCSIWKIGYKPKNINLTIDISITQTEIQIFPYNDIFYRKDNPTLSIDLYVNDTVNNKSVLGLTTVNITVIDLGDNQDWDDSWELTEIVNGNYTLDINVSKGIYDSGQYNMLINVSGFPNYNWSTAPISFTLLGNSSVINMVTISYTEAGIIPKTGDNYTAFVGNDLIFKFNITDSDFSDSVVEEETGLSCVVGYNNTDTIDNGTLVIISPCDRDANTNNYSVTVEISALTVGNYSINITLTLRNHEVQTYFFNLTIVGKFQVRITIDEDNTDEEVEAGKTLKITIKAEYNNGSTWKPLKGIKITAILYITASGGTQAASIELGETKSAEDEQTTNSKGIAEFELTIPSDATKIKIVIEIEGDYNITGKSIEIPDITVTAPPTLTFEDLLPYLILIGIAVGIVGGSVGIYRGVVVPKKREKERILSEVKTIFEDAINLEHILVLYKGTGTCIFFKSYGMEEIDPELISGFLTAVSSFGKEMESQQALNEITYGDKMLLLSDGEYTRVALVLGKKASIMLSKHLKDFIDAFEKRYSKDLPNWRGQLNIFMNSGQLVDDNLNTSIILPHEITFDFASVKDLKNPDSRIVLKIANSLVKDSDRKFFFIATILKEAVEKTGKDNAEIFMGIKELRDKKILMPIQISSLEEQPISDQEINLINQRVASLPNLTNEEKQNLVANLAQMGPVEREAYLTSLEEQEEIVSAPIQKGATVVDNAKAAKKEISNLIKRAKASKKEKDYEKANNIYRNAAMIAASWELNKLFEELEDQSRMTTIENLENQMRSLESDGKIATKQKDYTDAAQYYQQASEIASEIFKLGVTERTKEVKFFANKSKECQRLSEQ